MRLATPSIDERYDAELLLRSAQVNGEALGSDGHSSKVGFFSGTRPSPPFSRALADQSQTPAHTPPLPPSFYARCPGRLAPETPLPTDGVRLKTLSDSCESPAKQSVRPPRHVPKMTCNSLPLPSLTPGK